MNRILTAFLALLVANLALAEGTNDTQAIPCQPELTDGVYKMDADLKKPGVQHNYGWTDECRVTVRNGYIKIEPLEAYATNAVYEGSVKGQQVEFSLHFKNPDPIIEHYQFVQLWKGYIISNDTAKGDMSAYAGTNLYMSGTWSLKKDAGK
jgi:hypothetical protein